MKKRSRRHPTAISRRPDRRTGAVRYEVDARVAAWCAKSPLRQRWLNAAIAEHVRSGRDESHFEDINVGIYTRRRSDGVVVVVPLET